MYKREKNIGIQEKPNLLTCVDNNNNTKKPKNIKDIKIYSLRKKIYDNTCVVCLVSHVACHLSPVTCHLSLKNIQTF